MADCLGREDRSRGRKGRVEGRSVGRADGSGGWTGRVALGSDWAGRSYAAIYCPSVFIAFAMLDEAVSPDEAAMWDRPFVYRPCVRGVACYGALLLEWVAPRARVGRHGITGAMRLLQAEPASFREGQAGNTFRIHVCRTHPCPAESWHPSKYGSCPPPQAHGCVQALVEEAGAASLGSYLHVRGDSGEEVVASAKAEAGVFGDMVPSDVLARAPSNAAADPESMGVSSCSAPAPTAAPATATDLAGNASTCVEADIRRRGDAIRKCGTYIGVFEILAFCALRRRRVSLWFLDGCLDVTMAHAPFLHDSTWVLSPYPVAIIACTRSVEWNAWEPWDILQYRALCVRTADTAYL